VAAAYAGDEDRQIGAVAFQPFVDHLLDGGIRAVILLTF